MEKLPILFPRGEWPARGGVCVCVCERVYVSVGCVGVVVWACEGGDGENGVGERRGDTMQSGEPKQTVARRWSPDVFFLHCFFFYPLFLMVI